MVSATNWRVRAIVSIGNFLSELPPVHELYKNSMESDAEDSEHDVFGHAHCGMDEDVEAAGTPASCWADNPDAVCMQGRFELGEHAAATPKVMPPESLGHQWQWSGRSWQCANCMRSCRSRQHCQIKCQGLPASIGKAIAAATSNGHTLAGARDSSGCACIWCVSCGSYGSCRALHLNHSCHPPTRQGKTVLSRLEKGIHPDGSKKMQSAGIQLVAEQVD